MFGLVLKPGRCWVGLCALLATACTKFASELDQPDDAAESTLNSLSPPGGNWSCIATASAPGPVDRLPLTYSLSVIDFVTDSPLGDVRVRACFRPDVNCDSPASEWLVPDAAGRVNVTAYAGFNGYLEIASTGMLPLLLFFAAPWSAALLEQLQQVPTQLMPLPAVRALGASARTALDPESGIVGVYTYDCLGARAPGVRLEIDTGAIPFSFVDDLPVANQDRTSEQGFAGFVNVLPGVVIVRGFPEGQAAPVTVDSMLVRTGWLSSMSLLPSFSR